VLGTKIKKADKLSRRPNWKVETENDNSNQTLIKDYYIHNLVGVVIKELEIYIVEKVLREKEWEIESDLVLKKEKVYIPKNEELRVEII